MKKKRLTEEERLALWWSKVDRDSDPDGCWTWTGYLDPYGYGRFYDNGLVRNQNRSASRWGYHHLVNPIPTGMHVLHRCDNRACCRPEHLFLGTQVDNNNDRHAKGRNARTSGAGLPQTKLTESMKIVIRQRYAAGAVSQERLAREYGVHQGTISRAILPASDVRRFA